MVKSIQRVGQFFIALLVVVMGVSSGAFAADTSSPDKLISSLFEGVNERLKQDADKIADTLNRFHHILHLKDNCNVTEIRLLFSIVGKRDYSHPTYGTINPQ